MPSSFSSVQLYDVATEQNFDEDAYLAANPDVRAAVHAGHLKSGIHHFRAFGMKERRRLKFGTNIENIRSEKLKKLHPLLLHDVTPSASGKLDYLTSDLKEKYNIVDTENVSAHPYDPVIVEMIYQNKDGLILDAGAGLRNIYYGNVINYDIVDYETTDVIGVGEELPFVDNSFEGVISIAVLEHVKDPFKCAAEISRVLKLGGQLICCVPFLQPLHGYPHHYYNMTHQGLRSLFDKYLKVERQEVIDSVHPVHAISWILGSWAQGLHGPIRDAFLKMTVTDLTGDPWVMVNEPYARGLSNEKKFELACGTLLIGRKE